MWSPDYWADWYERLDSHVIPLLRRSVDQVEVGAPPVETDDGWLLIYADIQDYLRGETASSASRRPFSTATTAAGHRMTHDPLLRPEAPYETWDSCRA